MEHEGKDDKPVNKSDDMQTRLIKEVENFLELHMEKESLFEPGHKLVDEDGVPAPAPEGYSKHEISYLDNQNLLYVARSIERVIRFAADSPSIYNLHVFTSNERLSSSSDADGRKGFCAVFYFPREKKWLKKG